MTGLEAVRAMFAKVDAEITGKYTYRQLVERMEGKGNNLADVAVGRMMDIVGEQTGTYPDWNHVAPNWVVVNCLG